MSMRGLYSVNIDDLTIDDFVNLDKALKNNYDNISVEDVLQAVAFGNYELYRFDSGIIVAEIWKDTLRLLFAGGRNFIKNLDYIVDDLSIIAKSKGLKNLKAVGSSSGMQRVYSKKFKEIGKIYLKEI